MGEGEPTPGRALGVDLGSVRIGLARSDAARRVAIPHGVFGRTGTRARDHDAIAALVAELEIALVVVGLPLSLSGDVGPAAAGVLEEVEQLRARLPVPVVTADERFSSVEAARLREPAVTGGRRPRARRRPVRPIDDGAAAILLQAYLDAEGARR